MVKMKSKKPIPEKPDFYAPENDLRPLTLFFLRF
jgi:hypothetical protein